MEDVGKNITLLPYRLWHCATACDRTALVHATMELQSHWDCTADTFKFVESYDVVTSLLQKVFEDFV